MITLVGGAFAVLEHHQSSGVVLLVGGLVISLGANAFESAVYALKLSAAENVAMNFGRASGFGLGAYFGLLLLPDAHYTWLAFGSAVAGVLVTYLWKKHWVQPVDHPRALRGIPARIALVLGALVAGTLVVLLAIYH